MTASKDAVRIRAGNVPIYGDDGGIIATVGASRSRWLGTLLSECPVGHVYVFPEFHEEWQHAG